MQMTAIRRDSIIVASDIPDLAVTLNTCYRTSSHHSQSLVTLSPIHFPISPIIKIQSK